MCPGSHPRCAASTTSARVVGRDAGARNCALSSARAAPTQDGFNSHTLIHEKRRALCTCRVTTLLRRSVAHRTYPTHRFSGAPTRARPPRPPTRGDLPLPCCLRGRPYTIWDIGGNSTTRQFWQYYTKGKDALIWVIDSADLDKITEGELELALLLSSAQLARSGARTCHSGEGVRVCGGGWVTFGIVPRTPLANKQAESTRPIHLIREPFRPPPPNVFRRHTRRCWWWRTSRTWAAPYPPRTSHCCCGRC